MHRRSFLVGLAALSILPRAYAASFSFPDIQAYTEQGRETTLFRVLENYSGRAVILHAWASYCKPCIADMPILNELEKKIAIQGIYLTSKDSLEEDQELLQQIKTRENHHTPNILLQNSSQKAIFKEYKEQTGQTFVIPTYFFLSKEGQCISIEDGTLGNKERMRRVKKTIERLLE